jgi:twitching motility protein PilT
MTAAALSHSLQALLARCTVTGASDLHIASGLPPYWRVDGVVVPSEDEPPLSVAAINALARELTGIDPGELLSRKNSTDGAATGPDGTRFRYNVYRRRGALNMAIRRLEDRFRSIAELGLPESLLALCRQNYGLVVVAGPTGSGKSTTLATFIDQINRTRRCHVLTIEDPVEYVHPSRMSLVNQRQLGEDAATFDEALVSALRQDPDVILVGEIRDLPTIRTAISAAETGHLVFTTVHAGDCVGAIERMIGVFPSGEQEGVRKQLSLVLRAVITQHLLVSESGGQPGVECRPRRVLAAEVLTVTPAVANLVAAGKSNLIYSAMESGGAQGMQTMETSLAQLLARGDISQQAVVSLARSPSQVFDRAEKLRRRQEGSL